MEWKAIARSAVGTSHQKQQTPCQDFAEYRTFNSVIIGAVCDGAGSARHSDIGAKLVVNIVLDYLERIEDLLGLHQQQSLWHKSSQHPVEREAKIIFSECVSKALAALQIQATSLSCSVDDLACTILAFVATPWWIMAMQIGDGFIVVAPPKGDYQLLFPSNKGEFVNETTFITSPLAYNEMQVSIVPTNPAFICASTDGLEMLAIRMSDHTPFPPFFNPLEEYLWETSNPEENDAYIINFLNSPRLNARTDDDKTLLICMYKE